jgi:hypothetical protein
MPSEAWIAIPIIAMVLPVILVPIILGIKYARHERELEHAERMRALELGRTLPRDESWWSPGRICVVIGAGIPAGAFLSALAAGESLNDPEPAWIAAGIVSVAAVVSGSLLAHRHLPRRDEGRMVVAKPEFDADAFDHVGTRG